MRLATALPPGSFAEYGIPPGRGATDFEMLASSVVVENFLREVVAWGRILAQIRIDLDATVEDIQDRIQQNLDRP